MAELYEVVDRCARTIFCPTKKQLASFHSLSKYLQLGNKGMNVLVVGGSVIDLFVRLQSAHHTSFQDDTITFTLGDKIPIDIDRLTLGGNGANVSVGLARLGIPTTFFTYLGSDILSREIEEGICKEGITLLAEKREVKNTSIAIIFNFERDRIIFSHHQVRDHGFEYSEKVLPGFIYLTSIGNYWKDAYKNVVSFAQKHNIPLAFSPGSHQLEEIEETFLKTLKSSELLFINKQEAEKILAHIQKNHKDIPTMLLSLQEAGPSVVSITEGEKGAYAIDRDGTMYNISTFTGKVIERTGAGDAYATGFFAGYLFRQGILECMRWGVFNATSVIQYIGAQEGLLRIERMKKLLAEHPEFRAEQLR